MKNARINKFGGPGPRQDKRATRQQNAVEWAELWRSHSPARRLAMLDARLGDGVGATKQRARILKEAA